MIPKFTYHPRMLDYDFGPSHPLRPERLERAVALLESVAGLEVIDPGPGNETDLLRVHSAEYVEAVKILSLRGDPKTAERYGFGPGDNPIFDGMFEAALAYVAGSVRAAEWVRDGAPLAFGLAGGLHHAHRSRASGFCVFNDPAIAIHVLRERFGRVAYFDIDVHHGDGVQWLFFDDPHVLTCSIHESGKTLFPGTGSVEENGAAFTSLNVPLEPDTTGDVWLWAFEQTILPAIEKFQPQAVVLQMGTDAHFSDPLAHLRVAAQEWLQAVRRVSELGIPIVALGGGGYEPTAVPRMWSAAVMTLAGVAFEDAIPTAHSLDGAMPTFFDPELPQPRGAGQEEAEQVVRLVHRLVVDNLKAP